MWNAYNFIIFFFINEWFNIPSTCLWSGWTVRIITWTYHLIYSVIMRAARSVIITWTFGGKSVIITWVSFIEPVRSDWFGFSTGDSLCWSKENTTKEQLKNTISRMENLIVNFECHKYRGTVECYEYRATDDDGFKSGFKYLKWDNNVALLLYILKQILTLRVQCNWHECMCVFRCAFVRVCWLGTDAG